MPNRFPLRRLWIVALLGVVCTLTALSVTLAAQEKSAPRQQAATRTPTATRTPSRTHTPTPTPTATHTPTRSGPFVALPGGPIIFDFPTPRPAVSQGPISGQTRTALERSALAVVKLYGCAQAAEQTCTYSEGSGILIHPRGLILTALHVVIEDPLAKGSPLLPEISVGLVDNPDTPAQPRYRARVAAIEPDLDLALLWIDPPSDGSVLNLPSLPVETVDNRGFREEELWAMGFLQGSAFLAQPKVTYYRPHSSGAVEIEGSLVRSGFSGSPLLVQKEEGYRVGGVVFYRTDGPVLVQPVRRLANMRWIDPAMPRLWAEDVQIETIGMGVLAELRMSANIHAPDLAGQDVRLDAVAFDPAQQQPWPSADKPLILQRTFELTRFVDVVSPDLRVSLLGLPALPERLRFDLRIWDVEESRLLWSGEAFYLRPVVASTATLPSTPTATDTPIATPTRTTPPTTTPTAINTLRPTATPAKTATINQAVINAERLNLRDGPGLGYAILGSYPKGTTVVVTGKNGTASWLEVKMPDNKRGWMSTSLLIVYISLTDVALAEVPPLPPTPVPSPTSMPTPTSPKFVSPLPPGND